MQSKLEELSANIQNHIYNNFIQPSIEKFNQKLNNNVSEVKKEIKKFYWTKTKKNRKRESVSETSSYNDNSVNESHFSNYDILIVDDTPMNVLLLQKMLQKLKFTLESAADGESALELIRQRSKEERPFSLILLDLRMPGVSGFDVLMSMKNIPGAEQSPVVVLSGMTDSVSINEAIKLGAKNYLQKPIIMQDLFDIVFSLLGIE